MSYFSLLPHMPQQNHILSLPPCDIFIAASLTSSPSVHFITASIPAHYVDNKMQLQTSHQNASLCFNPSFHSKKEEIFFGKIPNKTHILYTNLADPPTWNALRRYSVGCDRSIYLFVYCKMLGTYLLSHQCIKTI